MKVAIAGAGGRMGRTLIEAVLADSELELAAALEVSGSPVVGTEIGKTKVTSDAGMVALRRRADRFHPARGHPRAPEARARRW